MARHTLALLLLAAGAHASVAEDWTSWRGPRGNGCSSDTGFPLRWTDSENVKWQIGLPGPGSSTPIVAGPRVFVSCTSQQGRQHSLICVDRQTGRSLWQQDVPGEQDEPLEPAQPYCASSPVTDGQRVVVWHGSAGLHAYDIDGAHLWSLDLGRFQHLGGNGSSPIIFGDLVILNAGPGLHAFLVAVDKRTGEERWRRQFPDMASRRVDALRGSFSTPLIMRRDEQDLLLISLPRRLSALDPLSGQEVWYSDGLGDLIYSSPISASGTVVAMSGHHGPAMAVRVGGHGDVTSTHRLWLHDERPPQRVGSGIIVDGYVYILNEPGIAWCLELLTGEIVWKQRLSNAPSWSSMCLADGRLYVSDLEGTTFVLAPDPAECIILAKNALGEPMGASLAFSQGQIFARTREHLYCLQAAE